MATYKKKRKATYVSIPYAVMDHPNYLKLSPYGVKLIADLLRQYNGFNNGDLCATWKLMKLKGWRSPSTLFAAIRELIYYGFIQLTQQGGKHRPNLYALTWHKIDECKGKMDVTPTKEASGLWKVEKEKFDPKPSKEIKKRSRNTYQSSRNVYQLKGKERVKPC